VHVYTFEINNMLQMVIRIVHHFVYRHITYLIVGLNLKRLWAHMYYIDQSFLHEDIDICGGKVKCEGVTIIIWSDTTMAKNILLTFDRFTRAWELKELLSTMC
jgi:hypothetical protein